MAHEREHAEPGLAEAGPGHSGPDLLSLLWRRKSLIALGGVIGLVLGAMYYARLTPVYQSTAQVLVVKKRPDEALPMAGLDARYGFFEDYLATHREIIRSPLIIHAAVKKGQLRALPSFAGKGDPTGQIRSGLSVTRDTKEGGATNILILSYTCSEAKDCEKVLVAIIDSYKDFLEATYKDISAETVDLVTKARGELVKEFKEKEEAYNKFRLQAPHLIKRKDGGNLRQERLAALEINRLQLGDRRLQIKKMLDGSKTARKEGKSPADVFATLTEAPAIKKEPVSAALRQAAESREDPLVALLLQEQMLLEDFGADHPQVRSVRKRIEFLRTFDKHYALAGLGTTPTEAVIKARILELEREDAALAWEEDLLGELAKTEADEARKLLETEQQEAAAARELARIQQLFEGVVKRLTEINLIKDVGGFKATTISPAGPGWRVGPRSTPIFSVAIFLGLLAGLGLSYVAELQDKSFRTPDEIRRRLGLPVVGYIPMLRVESATAEEQASALDPSLYAYHRAKSREAEAYRGVRTALLFSARRDGVRIIQVTSPEMADGKTTLVANLAISLAQSGKRVLLIDADFRRPRIHKMFGLSADRGLATVIAGEGDVSAVVQPSGVEGLAVLPCGPIPPNPAELLTSPRFQEALKALDAQYDFVLVDTPPLLAVTDPSSVVPCVDGVLVVIRFSRHARPKAERARDMLAALGARVLGVIVNGVGDRGFARHGYEQYHYGYGNSSYYSDEADGQAEGEAGAEPGTTAARPRRASRQGKRRRFPWFFGWW
jgi:capsular exopolysaccharide synthesis family protein